MHERNGKSTGISVKKIILRRGEEAIKLMAIFKPISRPLCEYPATQWFGDRRRFYHAVMSP